MKKPPIVRLPPKSNFEMLIASSARIALIVLGLIGLVFALHAAAYVLAPIFMGVVIGLMLGPIATRLERHLAPSLSAALVVLLFIFAVSLFALALAAPLTAWVTRIPQIWTDLQLQLSQLREPLQTIETMREQLREMTGGSEVTVTVDEGSPVEDVATLAPGLIAQVLLFFASLYFFMATRNETRNAILRLCFDRRLRWRVAHIFRDVETSVSKYLLTITLINIAEGLAVAVAMAAIGLPSAALWGALAGLLNFVPYIGAVVMTAMLFVVGLTVYDTLAGSLLPPLLYLTINMIEAQFVTPMAIGRAMRLNPFVVLLALAFWLWLWGPIGGFIAIPALLIVYAVVSHILPNADWAAVHGGPARR